MTKEEGKKDGIRERRQDRLIMFGGPGCAPVLCGGHL